MNKLNPFLFPNTSPEWLGLYRTLFFGTFFLFYFGADFSGWGEVSPVFWRPLPLFTFFHLGIASAQTLAALQLIWKLSLVASAFGWHSRPSMAVAALLGTYLLGLPHCFGGANHVDNLVVLTLLVFAFSDAGDGFSLDSQKGGPRQPSGSYGWPLFVIRFAIAATYFAAAVAKLKNSGAAWVTSDYLRGLLAGSYFFGEVDTPLGLKLARYPMLCHLGAAATVATELLFPLVLFFPRSRLVLVPCVIFLHAAIWFLFDMSFAQNLILCLFWIGPSRLDKPVGHFHHLPYVWRRMERDGNRNSSL